MTTVELIIAAIVGLSLAIPAKATTRKRKSKRKSSPSTSRPKKSANQKSNDRRSDDVILCTRVEDLSWAEFERLLALYFRDHGYDVEETGVGGKDGGIDLVITDRKTKERTAVQAKHWGNGKYNVGPDKIRELHSARLNTTPMCLYGLLVTSADVTVAARKEAEARSALSYWHGATLQDKLEHWDKYKPSKKAARKRPMQQKTATSVSQVSEARKQVSVSSETEGNCPRCGSPLKKRANKQTGEVFWGCSNFPKCRYTKPTV